MTQAGQPTIDDIIEVSCKSLMSKGQHEPTLAVFGDDEHAALCI